MKKSAVAKVEVTMPCGHTITVPETPKRTPLEVDERTRILTTMIHLFDRLGNTTSDWRKQLFREEIRGSEGDSTGCVLAVYLGNHMQGYQLEVNGGKSIIVSRDQSPFPYHFSSRDLGGHTRRISTFIRHFDNGSYRELLHD